MQILNRAKAYTMSETDSQDTQKVTISPAHPRRAETRLSPGDAADQNNTGGVPSAHVEDYFEARTKLEAFFSILSNKGGQRRIHNRMPNQSFQPWCHVVFREWSLVETHFNLELFMPPNNTDDRRRIVTVG